LKFGDVILAVALMAVIFVLLYSVFIIALIPSMYSYTGQDVRALIAMLVAGLLVGFLFAGKMQEESKIRAVGKIAVMFAFVTLLIMLMGFFGSSYYIAWTKETLQGKLVTVFNLAINVVLALVLGFIGLYAGSMLRKPKKTEENPSLVVAGEESNERMRTSARAEPK
jgi:hypothetical protein